MKALFAHDHRFVQTAPNTVYSEGRFSAQAWDRYLQFFDQLVVLGRLGEVSPNLDRLTLSSRPEVAFMLLPQREVYRKVLWRSTWLYSLIRPVDAVIVRLPSVLGVSAARVAMQLGKPWAVEVVGSAWQALWYHGSVHGKIAAIPMELLTRRVVRRATHVIYVTKRWLQSAYPTSGIWSYASNVNVSTQPQVLEGRLHRIATRRRPLVFGMIGTLRSRYKGIQTAIIALGQARQKLPRFEFRVLGDGDPTRWKQVARRYGLEDVVQFDGIVPSGDPVFNWLDNIDIYLQPSLTEGLPRSLVEAMSRGCPAIGSAVGGIPELLDPRWLHKPGNHDQLCEKIVQLAHSREYQREQAIRNFNVAKEYERDVLEARRYDFWSDFARYVAQNSS